MAPRTRRSAEPAAGGEARWADLPAALMVSVLDRTPPLGSGLLARASRAWSAAHHRRTILRLSGPGVPDQLGRQHPELRALELVAVPLGPSQLTRLIQSAPGRLRSLGMIRTVAPSGMDWPARLTELTLCAVDGLSDGKLAQLLGRLVRLTTVCLASTRCADQGCEALARLRLCSLDLSATRVTDAGLARLSEGSAGQTLRRLCAGGSKVRLAVPLSLPALEELDLGDRGPLPDKDIWAAPSLLVAFPTSCPRLIRLRLGGARVRDSSGLAGLCRLEQLSLANSLADQAWIRLGSGLTELNLTGTVFEAAELLGPAAPGLAVLLLANCRRLAGDAVSRLFGDGASFGRLHTLSLYGTAVGEEGSEGWWAAPESLRRLDLGSTRVGDSCCEALDGSRLAALNLGGTQVTGHGVQRLGLRLECVLNLFDSRPMLASLFKPRAAPGELLHEFR